MQPADRTSADATVIVCTYNRCKSLEDTLRAMQQQVVPPDISWELIVVDNNSSDGTQALVAEWQTRLPGLRYQFEERQGLSYARNRGIEAANGALLLFTDDDVIPESDWVATVVRAMKLHGCDGLGGYIAPLWEETPPPWLTDKFHGFLAIRMDNHGPRLLEAEDDPPFGANMAFRREVFSRLGGFDVNRGHKGKVLAGGEEWDLFARLRDSGGKVVYIPAARVHHKVEAFRLNKRYFRRWRYQNSRNIGETQGVPGARTLLGIPPYLIAQTVKSGLRTVWGYVLLPSDEAFRTEMIAWHFLGLVAGLMQRSHRRRATASTGTRP